MRIALAALAALALMGCETIKPYEKEYLLCPLMDDDGVTHLTPAFMGAVNASYEKLSAGAQNSGGTACPTCGG
jgi:hypothetical protein